MNDFITRETQIKKEIMSLPSDKRGQLLQWLIDMDKRDWDRQLEDDFSGDGAGVSLLHQVKEEFRSGKCDRWK